MGKFAFYPVILAGGRGTRFWPLSRKRMAKQLLPLNSEKSMIQETVERLRPLAQTKQFWIITNGDLRDAIVRQLKGLKKEADHRGASRTKHRSGDWLSGLSTGEARPGGRDRNVSVRPRHREREAFS